MAKTKLGNVKGPKGDQGVRGSKWYNTDKITGTSTSGTAFPQSGIADAMPGDMALNPTTLNLYICREGGAAASAKWAYLSCIKGPQGERGPKGEPTTVDASLSESSTNPIQNKIVASNFKDVRDFLSRLNLTDGGCAYFRTPKERISVQLTADKSQRSAVIGVTPDCKLYIDYCDDNGHWYGARLI